MYYFAEHELYSQIGIFSTVPQLINTQSTVGRNKDRIEFANDSNQQYQYGVMPGQCQAFLTSNLEFTFWIEQWDINNDDEGANLINKKIYPAKVSGINLPLLGISVKSHPVTVRWRDGLIRTSNNEKVYDIYYGIKSYRPGFGQMIFSDLERPLKELTIQTNNLGLAPTKYDANYVPFTGPLGRLMSIASYVDPELAKQYDTSKSKKKKKSPNEQDYQNPPEYPAYDLYTDPNGY